MRALPMTNKPSHTVYLDSSIFTAWLMDEERKGDEMDGVYDCFERIRKWEIQAIVSTLYLAEINIDQYSAEKRSELYQLLSERNPLVVGIDDRVCKLAGQLRWFYENKSKSLKTPDALHLAAAIHHGANEFYIFDDKVENKRSSLIDLSGSVAGHVLAILKPPVTRPRLDLSARKGRDGDKEED